uniref:Uncharacterized protein n=1 Tax=Aegilops tauschii subsp. strangulata TaxID=200361 RepID=A0A453R6T9_AEGTS
MRRLIIIASRDVCRWAHKPGSDVRAVHRREGDAGALGAVRGGAVPRRRRRRGHREGDHEAPLRRLRRRRQRGGRGVLARGGPRRGDLRHLRPRLHRLLRHRPQAHRPRRLRPPGGGSPNRFGGVRGAPGDHPDHRHGHQPGEEPGRRRAVQPAQNLEATLDLLGRALHRRGPGGVLPQDRAARRGCGEGCRWLIKRVL